MRQNKNKDKQWGEITKSFFFSYLVLTLILVLNIALFFVVGIIVIFFKGVLDYITWILILGGVLISTICYLFWKRMKEGGQTFKEMMDDPLLRGRDVEVNLLGGFFSVKIGRPTRPLSIEDLPSSQPKQLEVPQSSRVSELAHLASLLEKNLITREEFFRAKEELMRSPQ
jgi:hypothetical protein